MAYDPLDFYAVQEFPNPFPVDSDGSIWLRPSASSTPSEPKMDAAFIKLDGTPGFIMNWDYVGAMIVDEVAKVKGKMITVANIADRDSDSATRTGDVWYYVVDASADPTVNQFGAVYIYHQESDEFEKLYETEKNDVAITWAAMQAGGGPQSSAAAIDAAVAQSHSHARLQVLEKIDEVGGRMHYDGKPVVHWKLKEV